MVNGRIRQQATLDFKAVPLQYLKLKGLFLSKTALNFKVVGASFRALSALNSKDNSIYSHGVCFIFGVLERLWR